jgi:hypothetical protein
MALYPASPVPSEVHPPEIIDPSIEFVSDYGYSIRRPRTSRPRRRWTLDYLGVNTANMRVVRDFLQEVRLGAVDFQWYHPTAIELALFQPTTPVNVLLLHGMTTGMWVGVSNTPNPNINGGVFQITRTTNASFTLNGTTAAGIEGNGNVIIYLPHATAVTQEGTLSAPSTLIGPERIPIAPDVYRGIYNFSVVIEEQF